MNDRFERMVDQVLNYKPPPKAKKAKERMAEKEKVKRKSVAQKKAKK